MHMKPENHTVSSLGASRENVPKQLEVVQASPKPTAPTEKTFIVPSPDTEIIPPLPTEIKDEIINHLHDDHRVLSACSLAASIFLAPARHHLFSEVRVEYSKLCAFLELLDTPWCSIAPAIVRMSIYDRKSLRIHDSNPIGSYVPANGMRLVSRLQGVKRIRFSHLSFSKISPFWHLLHGLKAVRELEFHKMRIESPFPFFQYICSLPLLAALSITQSSMPTTTLDMSLFRRVKELSIPLLDATKASYVLLDWFLAQDVIPHVQMFVLDLNRSPMEILTVCKYAEAIGPSVHNLHIRLPVKIKTYVEGPSHINFTPFTAVRSIHFEGHIGQESHALEIFMRNIFQQIPSLALTEVSLTVSLQLADEALAIMGITDQCILEAFNWGRLPEILECRIGVNLRALRVVVKGYPAYWGKQAEVFLRTRPFSVFHARGVFHVDFVQPSTGVE